MRTTKKSYTFHYNDDFLNNINNNVNIDAYNDKLISSISVIKKSNSDISFDQTYFNYIYNVNLNIENIKQVIDNLKLEINLIYNNDEYISRNDCFTEQSFEIIFIDTEGNLIKKIFNF
jgi:hypothetical protein